MTHTPGPDVLAIYTRSGFIEGVHVGHAVVIEPAGAVTQQWGDPDHVILPRSSNKIVQATAMVRQGLDLQGRLLALSAASHSGHGIHLDGVREVLSRAGLDESDLQTPPDFPLDPAERDTWIAAGRGAASIAMNCSGKHAAMLLTCVINDWPTATYRDSGHPLQQAIRAELEALSGEQVQRVGVDGCGAPVMAISLAGLARSVSRCIQGGSADPGRRVVDAMRAHPEYVGGDERDVTAFMRAVPGLVAKDGAEGVFVAALPDGTAIAVKIEDGADRARQVVMASILTDLLAARGSEAVGLEPLRTIPLLGAGRVVGQVESVIANSR